MPSQEKRKAIPRLLWSSYVHQRKHAKDEKRLDGKCRYYGCSNLLPPLSLQPSAPHLVPNWVNLRQKASNSSTVPSSAYWVELSKVNNEEGLTSVNYRQLYERTCEPWTMILVRRRNLQLFIYRGIWHFPCKYHWLMLIDRVFNFINF